MKKENERRDFLGKFALGVSSLIALPFFNSAKERTNKKEMIINKAILKIKPLGFQWETADPFLFCVHHEDFYPKGNEEMGPSDSLAGRHLGQDFIIKDGYRMYHGDKIPGFPGHPHRGFETITVVRKGLVDHADSTGASGRYGNGDVQWMTAGKGVQHSEMFPLLSETEENPLELFQIWLNLPRKNKMVEPHFKMLWNQSIPIIHKNDENGLETKIEVISGEIESEKAPSPPPNSWANDSENHVAIYNITMEPGANYILKKALAGINRTIYFYEGDRLSVQNENIPTYHGVEVLPEFDLEIKNEGSVEAKILVLQGKPINEPVVQHGPFVMNTREEIQDAFNDYHKTQFGGWPWPKTDQVHDRSLGRFAKHADGTEEIQQG